MSRHMVSRSITLVVLLGLLSQPSLAQVAGGNNSRSTVEQSVPIYRVTVVGRTTAAINYRRSGDTKVDLIGTALLPEAHGVAEVSAGTVIPRSTRISAGCSEPLALEAST